MSIFFLGSVPTPSNLNKFLTIFVWPNRHLRTSQLKPSPMLIFFKYLLLRFFKTFVQFSLKSTFKCWLTAKKKKKNVVTLFPNLLSLTQDCENSIQEHYIVSLLSLTKIAFSRLSYMLANIPSLLTVAEGT